VHCAQGQGCKEQLQPTNSLSPSCAEITVHANLTVVATDQKERMKTPHSLDIEANIMPLRTPANHRAFNEFYYFPGRAGPTTPNPHTPWQSIQKSLGCTPLLPLPMSIRLWGVRRHSTSWRLVGIPFWSTLQTVQVALFRWMLDVIFVTHQNILTKPTLPVWKPSWYATIPDLLCVHAVPVLLKIWWWCINNSPEWYLSPYGLGCSFVLLAGGCFL